MKSSSGMSRFELIGSILVVFFVAFFVLTGTFPAGCRGFDGRKAQAKNDVVQIATTVSAFETEYDHLPAMPTNGLVGGDLVSTLVGSNQTLNPHNVRFIEIDTAKEGIRSGLRADGTFVDPWGGVYRIAIATGTNTSVIAGTNQIVVPKKIAVWNDPATHPDWASDAKKNRRYVTSWE